MTRTLALCADDFGQAAHISAGILRLARASRLNAISCITNTKHWPLDAPWLRELPAGIELGLHFNLTEGRPRNPRLARVWPMLPGLHELLVRTHLGLVPRGALRGEFEAQLRAFIDATGASPSYIDGHQHVHALPIVRGQVLDAAEHMRPTPALRNTGHLDGPGFVLKRRVIEASGGRALQRELLARELPHNPVLLGVYDFADTDYRALMQGWLARVPADGAMLMCHPGEAAPVGSKDPIGAARVRELAYLASPAVADDLARADVRLGPAWRVSRTSSAG